MSNDASTTTSASLVRPTQQKQISDRKLPKMTIGTSEEYIEKMAPALSHAMLPNVMWRLFFGEGVDGIASDASDTIRLQAYHSFVKEFLALGFESGALIAEAGEFSAYASWWPPGSHEPPKSPKYFDDMERQGKTLMAAFGRESEEIRIEHIWSRYGQDYWHLGLLGRDPTKPAVPGAVRAVLQPFIDQAAAEGKPIWLETTSEHAKNIYLHFGWQVVRQVTFRGYSVWCMILYPLS